MPDTTNRNLNNVQLSMNDPGAFLNLTRQLSGNVGSNVPTGGDLGSEIMKLLQTYQQYGQNTQYAAQQEQVNRIFQTPSSLIGAAPGVQAGVRGAAVQAMEPTIGGAQTLVSSANQAITNVQNYLKTIEENKNKQRDDARAAIKDALTLGGADSLNNLNPEDIIALEKQAGYPKGYIQGLKQTIKERELELKKQNAALTGGLTAAQINQTINQIAGAFDNEPIVKNYNTSLEGYQTLKTIGVKSKSPADDIAFIYGFAKIMDPNSVVREGEYNTIQKYAQTWANNFGFTATRIFSNTNFLSADAKQKMLNALEAKFGSIQTQYKNLSSEYQRQINDARTGLPRQITDYSKAFLQQETTPPPSTSAKYKPGSIIKSGKILYLVGADGKTITPVGSAL